MKIKDGVTTYRNNILCLSSSTFWSVGLVFLTTNNVCWWQHTSRSSFIIIWFFGCGLWSLLVALEEGFFLSTWNIWDNQLLLVWQREILFYQNMSSLCPSACTRAEVWVQNLVFFLLQSHRVKASLSLSLFLSAFPFNLWGQFIMFVAVFLLFIIFGVGLSAYLSNHNPVSREHIFVGFNDLVHCHPSSLTTGA